MAVDVERMVDARWVNEVLNHAHVRPWIAAGDNQIDVSSQIADPRNVFLFGEYGGVGFLCVQDGIYEAHTSVLPSGRGKWTRAMTEACVRYMFTKTNAYEITTRVPAGHVAAKAAAEAQGLKFEFTQRNGVFFRGKTVDCHIHSCRIQDWIPRAEGVVETGAWLHRRMEEEAARLGIEVPTHEDDEIHNRYVGVAVEMMFGQQFHKGVSLYNRWVTLARHTRHGQLQHVSLVSVSPPVIQFDIGLMRFHADEIEVIRTC